MDKLITAIPVLLLLVFFRFILSYWTRIYKKENDSELKVNDIRTYKQFFFFYSKNFIYGINFLIIVLLLRITFGLIEIYLK